MTDPSYKTNPSSIRGEDSFILTNLNLPDDKKQGVTQRSNNPLFVSIKKATEIGRTIWLAVVEKKRPKQPRQNPRVRKKGDIPILEKNRKREEK